MCLAPTSYPHRRTFILQLFTFIVRHRSNCVRPRTSEVRFCGKYLQNRASELHHRTFILQRFTFIARHRTFFVQRSTLEVHF